MGSAQPLPMGSVPQGAPRDVRGAGRLTVLLRVGLVGLIALLVASSAAWLGLGPLAAVLGLIAALVVMRRPALGGPVFAAVLILNLPAIGARFYGVPPLVAGAASAILLIPIVAAAARGKPLLVGTPALPWIVAYGLALVLSTLASTAVGDAAATVSVFVMEGLVLYLLVTSSLRTRGDLRAVIWVVVLAGGLLGAVSIDQEARHAYDDTYLGLGQTQVGAIRVQDSAVSQPADRPRLAGPIGETNRYAQLMLVLLPLAIYLAASEPRRGARWLALACTAAILAAIVLTFSRGAIVVMVLLVPLMAMTGFVRWRTVLAGGLILVVLSATAVPGFVDRLESFRGVEGLVGATGEAADPDGAIIGRATSNLAALGTFLDHPILGVGPGIYYLDYSRLYANRLGLRYFDDDRRAHNLYLETAADTGVVGLTALMGVCAVTLLTLLRARRAALRRGDALGARLCLAFVFSVVAYLGTALFLHLSYERYFWFMIALANVAGVLLFARIESHAEARPIVRLASLTAWDRVGRRPSSRWWKAHQDTPGRADRTDRAVT
ncbi:MAG: O-antigen ligase family protein [Chloroflexota bacterium]